MNRRLKSQPSDPWEAMRVARFMRNAEHGRWQLQRFTRSAEEVEREQVRLHVTTSRHQIDLALARVVPEGEYMTLRRRMNEDEKRRAFEDQIGDPEEWAQVTGETVQEAIDNAVPPSHAWLPVMSDTPAELEGHRHAIAFAKGRVLVSGLGLGCLVAGLLVKPGITRIDVIEIDPDVIALTSAYYLDDPRVHLHVGSAADPATVPSDLSWDYAWHDIWSHVADRNLNDATAEHGISYGRLFRLYGHRAPVQSAWAYEEAKEMRRREKARRHDEQRWLRDLKRMEPEDQVTALVDRVLHARLPALDGQELTPKLREMFDPEGSLRDHLRQRVTEADFWADLHRVAYDDTPSEPLGNPNAHLEAAR